MPEADAHAFWQRFSAYMDEHKGDLAGFAAQEGFASVVPETGRSGARLPVSRAAAPPAYGNAKSRKT